MKTKVLLVALGSAGDVLPFIHLGTVLSRAGLDVSVFTHDAFASKVTTAGLALLPMGDATEYPVFESNPALYRGPGSMLKYLEACGQVSTMTWPCLSASVKEFHLVLGTRFTFSAHLACQLAQVPFAAVALAPAHTSEGLEQQSPAARRVVNRAVLKHLRGPPDSVLQHLSRQEDTLLYFSAQPNLALFPEWFHQVPPIAGHWHQTGFCHLPLVGKTQSTETDLTIAFGSTFMDVTEELTLLAEVSRKRGLKAVAVTRWEGATGLERRFQPGLAIHSWADYDALFSRSRMVIHHGGIGTSLQALASGAPQLVLPKIFDRVMNARCLVDLGVAQKVDYNNLSAETLEAAIVSTLEGEGQQACARQVGKRVLEEAPLWEKRTVERIRSLANPV